MKADRDVVITTIYVVIDNDMSKNVVYTSSKTKDDGCRNSEHCHLFGAIFQ